MIAITVLYFLTYSVFSFVTKALGKEVGAVDLLPISVCACGMVWFVGMCCALFVPCVAAPARAALRRLFERDVLLAAGASTVVLCASTMAYATQGVSLLVPLLLMKGGVLLWGPLIDYLHGTAITRRSRVVLGLAVVSVGGALWHKVHVDFGNLATAAALVCAWSYTAAYFPKLKIMALHKGEVDFLLAELTMTLVLALPEAFAINRLWHAVHHTPHLSAEIFFNVIDRPSIWVMALASQGCGLFGGLIFMQPSSSSLSVSVSRCSSLGGGIAADVTLHVLRVGGPIGAALWAYVTAAGHRAELVGAAAMLAALWIGLSKPALAPSALDSSAQAR